MLQMIEDMGGSATTTEVPAESFKMATVIVTIGPIVFLYPVLQRYFIKGLVIGAIKG
jgi:putative aldouronate transport system permease protein